MMYGYGYGHAAMGQEVPLLNMGWVQVTSARFVVGHQTYPINGITSVAPFSVAPNRNGPFLLIGIALIVLFGGFAGQSGGTAVLGLIMGAIGIALVALAKPTHGVTIMTAGMNVRALVSKDIALVHGVVTALNQAIAMR